MSFSYEVKKELLAIGVIDTPRHCLIAELAAIINICGCFLGGIDNQLIVQSESSELISKTKDIISALFEIKSCRNTFKEENIGAKLIRLTVDDSQLVDKLSLVTKNKNQKIEGVDLPIDPLVVSSICCKRAYIRGAFECEGSLSDPNKNYHLEFVDSDYEHARCLRDLINSFGMDSKIVERKNNFIVYLKEGEQIVDLLNIVSAHKALLELENVRVIKEVRNNVNRRVNCEAANLNKVVNAAVEQLEAIEYIENTVGLDYLPEHLREIANIRKENTYISLKELGASLQPPISKSGVNHRLKKICDIAEKLRGT